MSLTFLNVSSNSPIYWRTEPSTIHKRVVNVREPNVTPNTSTHECRTRSKNPKCGSVSGRPKGTWRLGFTDGDRREQTANLNGYSKSERLQ